MVYLHVRKLFYGKLLLKHIILVVKESQQDVEKGKREWKMKKERSEDEENLNILDEAQARDHSRHVEVYLDGLNLDATVDMN